MKVQRFREILSDLLTAPLHLVKEAIDSIMTWLLYYPNSAFRRADLQLKKAYFGSNPYTICQKYLRDFPEDAVQKIYGETSLLTLEKIARAVTLREADVIYDLGCGRGRNIFWLNAMYKCRAIGIEINPLFVRRALEIKAKLQIAGVDFIDANIMELDYQDATVIYLYGTAFTDPAIVKLIDRLRSVKEGTRIVTVSYPLTHYVQDGTFKLVNCFAGSFVWGYADIYIQHRA